MPYKSQAQAAYFHIHRKKLEAQGVDVDEWDRATKGKKLPKKKKPIKEAMDGLRDVGQSLIELVKSAEDPQEKPIKVPLPDVRQKTTYTCGPSSLEAIAKGFGQDVSEDRIADLAGTSKKHGTPPNWLADAAAKLGFDVAIRQNMTIEELKAYLDQGFPVICDIQAWGKKRDFNKLKEGHYIVATGYSDSEIFFEEPSLKGKLGRLKYDELLSRWKDQEDEETGGEKTFRLGIIVMPSGKPKEPQEKPKTVKIGADAPAPSLVERAQPILDPAVLERLLKRYRKLYDTFDAGHNWQHAEAAASQAQALASKYLPPEQHEYARLAALLHDIGLSKGRDAHETHGADMVRGDKRLRKLLGDDALELIAGAVAQHRSSTGKPSTILQKIISDADRAQLSPEYAFGRPVAYSYANYPELSDDEKLWRAAAHLVHKFREPGYDRKSFGPTIDTEYDQPAAKGRNVHFPETLQRIDEVYAPVYQAYDTGDINALRDLWGRSELNKSGNLHLSAKYPGLAKVAEKIGAEQYPELTKSALSPTGIGALTGGGIGALLGLIYGDGWKNKLLSALVAGGAGSLVGAGVGQAIQNRPSEKNPLADFGLTPSRNQSAADIAKDIYGSQYNKVLKSTLAASQRGSRLTEGMPLLDLEKWDTKLPIYDTLSNAEIRGLARTAKIPGVPRAMGLTTRVPPGQSINIVAAQKGNSDLADLVVTNIAHGSKSPEQVKLDTFARELKRAIAREGLDATDTNIHRAVLPKMKASVPVEDRPNDGDDVILQRIQEVLSLPAAAERASKIASDSTLSAKYPGLVKAAAEPTLNAPNNIPAGLSQRELLPLSSRWDPNRLSFSNIFKPDQPAPPKPISWNNMPRVIRKYMAESQDTPDTLQQPLLQYVTPAQMLSKYYDRLPGGLEAEVDAVRQYQQLNPAPAAEATGDYGLSGITTPYPLYTWPLIQQPNNRVVSYGMAPRSGAHSLATGGVANASTDDHEISHAFGGVLNTRQRRNAYSAPLTHYSGLPYVANRSIDDWSLRPEEIRVSVLAPARRFAALFGNRQLRTNDDASRELDRVEDMAAHRPDGRLGSDWDQYEEVMRMHYPFLDREVNIKGKAFKGPHAASELGALNMTRHMLKLMGLPDWRRSRNRLNDVLLRNLGTDYAQQRASKQASDNLHLSAKYPGLAKAADVPMPLKAGLIGAGVGGLGSLLFEETDTNSEKSWLGQKLTNALWSALIGGGVGGGIGYLLNSVPEARGEVATYGHPRARLSLSDLIAEDYKNAPGGLEEAIRLAQEAQRSGTDPFVRWKPQQIYKEYPVYEGKLPANVSAGPGKTRGATQISSDGKHSVHMLDINETPYLKHELTHAALGDYRHSSRGGQRSIAPNEPTTRRVSGPFGIPSEIDIPKDLWKYMSSPDEIDAFLAQVKRDYVKDTGKHVETIQDANKALKHFASQKFSDGRFNSASTKGIATIFNVGGRLRDILLKRMTQIVTGHNLDTSKVASDSILSDRYPGLAKAAGNLEIPDLSENQHWQTPPMIDLGGGVSVRNDTPINDVSAGRISWPAVAQKYPLYTHSGEKITPGQLPFTDTDFREIDWRRAGIPRPATAAENRYLSNRDLTRGVKSIHSAARDATQAAASFALPAPVSKMVGVPLANTVNKYVHTYPEIVSQLISPLNPQRMTIAQEQALYRTPLAPLMKMAPYAHHAGRPAPYSLRDIYKYPAPEATDEFHPTPPGLPSEHEQAWRATNFADAPTPSAQLPRPVANALSFAGKALWSPVTGALDGIAQGPERRRQEELKLHEALFQLRRADKSREEIERASRREKIA